ncbi:MAG: class I SAM-dependent methyltransferase [Mycobacterium sp.]
MIWAPTGNPAIVTPRGSDAPVREGPCLDAVDAAKVRAAELASRRPMVADPYAGALLDGLGVAGRDEDCDPELSAVVAARTKWFDEFLVAAGAGGLAQVVVLAAGLDTRPWRLPWLADTVVYEVDRPHVLAYKSETMRAAGENTRIEYVPVPVAADVDWSKSLRAGGFDPCEPTVWAVEGVLPALPDGAWNPLFDQISLLSTRGSRIAVDAGEPTVEDIGNALCCRGWEITAFDARALMGRYHRETGHTGRLPSTAGGFIEGRLG